jgi:hypothetical protein
MFTETTKYLVEYHTSEGIVRKMFEPGCLDKAQKLFNAVNQITYKSLRFVNNLIEGAITSSNYKLVGGATSVKIRVISDCVGAISINNDGELKTFCNYRKWRTAKDCMYEKAVSAVCYRNVIDYNNRKIAPNSEVILNSNNVPLAVWDAENQIGYI